MTLCACGNIAREGRQECFRCHVRGIGFTFHGSANPGRSGWNRTATEWKLEHFGTSSDKELEKRGIVPAKEFGGGTPDYRERNRSTLKGRR